MKAHPDADGAGRESGLGCSCCTDAVGRARERHEECIALGVDLGAAVRGKRVTEGAAMRVERQLSVFLDNRPGTLARTCQALAKEGVNILALSMSDTVDHIVVRLIASVWGVLDSDCTVTVTVATPLSATPSVA